MISPKSALIAILTEPFRVPRFFLQKIFVWMLARKRNVSVQEKLKIVGFPLVDIHKEGRLIIGSGVRLNSRNPGYFLNLLAPVKLVVDRPGGEIIIGDNSRIHGSCIHASQSVRVGNNCLIAANCQIMDGSGHDLSFDDVENRIHTTGGAKPVKIEDNVWIGVNSIILPGVTIGYGSVIAAGSVVTKSIPPMCLAGGNPATVIREYASQEMRLRKMA